MLKRISKTLGIFILSLMLVVTNFFSIQQEQKASANPIAIAGGAALIAGLSAYAGYYYYNSLTNQPVQSPVDIYNSLTSSAKTAVDEAVLGAKMGVVQVSIDLVQKIFGTPTTQTTMPTAGHQYVRNATENVNFVNGLSYTVGGTYRGEIKPTVANQATQYYLGIPFSYCLISYYFAPETNTKYYPTIRIFVAKTVYNTLTATQKGLFESSYSSYDSNTYEFKTVNLPNLTDIRVPANPYSYGTTNYWNHEINNTTNVFKQSIGRCFNIVPYQTVDPSTKSDLPVPPAVHIPPNNEQLVVQGSQVGYVVNGTFYPVAGSQPIYVPIKATACSLSSTDTLPKNPTGEYVLEKGLNHKFIIEYSPADSNIFPDWTWSSSNTGVATVDGTGTITGVDVGSTVITGTGVIAGSTPMTLTIPISIIPPLPPPTGEGGIDWSKFLEVLKGLKTKLPFSIPWDVIGFFSVFNVGAQLPRFTMPFNMGAFDLSDISFISTYLRWGLRIFFDLGLIMNFRKFVQK